MRIVKRENRWQLFGLRLLVSLKFEGTQYQFQGAVVAVTVQDLQNHDYAIHLSFDEPVSEDRVKPLVPPEPVEDELPSEEKGRGDNESAGHAAEDEG
jgi:hypothetical protein